MAKINVGSSFDNSRLVLNAEISVESSIEINVGDGHDMSQRQISILEKQKTETSEEVAKLRDLVHQFATRIPQEANTLKISGEALKIAHAADQIQENHKWYAVSAKGLIEAAEAVGGAASPIVAAALKVVRLLANAKLEA